MMPRNTTIPSMGSFGTAPSLTHGMQTTDSWFSGNKPIHDPLYDR